MDLGKPDDFVDVFLETCYPAKEGWKCYRDVFVDNIGFDYAFRHSDGFLMLIQRDGGPIISTDKLLEISKLANRQELMFGNRSVQVMFVCGQLLVQPKQTPSNVRVVSLVDEYQNFTDHDMAFASCN